MLRRCFVTSLPETITSPLFVYLSLQCPHNTTLNRTLAGFFFEKFGNPIALNGTPPNPKRFGLSKIDCKPESKVNTQRSRRGQIKMAGKPKSGGHFLRGGGVRKGELIDETTNNSNRKNTHHRGCRNLEVWRKKCQIKLLGADT